MHFTQRLTYFLNFFLIISFVFLFSGCNGGVLCPKGSIALEQRSLIFISFLLMICIIIPVFFMTILFLVKYRENNTSSNYRPNWSHSSFIELLSWSFPVLIIFFLSVLSWNSSHTLDPNKHIISDVKPLKINVISLDWKWLFIYPDKNIATINELVFPVNTPIIFELTSNSVMNSFFIPSLGSQIYTMAGMKTQLNLISNQPGIYKGISSNYSGQGFSNMKFKTIVVSNYLLFQKWIERVKKSSFKLSSISDFKKVANVSENNAVKYYSSVKKHLFDIVVKEVTGIKK
ncbi:MAG: ubiquinol oxidase subunit II [Buchnera aphidicola (Melaphis rhois)]